MNTKLLLFVACTTLLQTTPAFSASKKCNEQLDALVSYAHEAGFKEALIMGASKSAAEAAPELAKSTEQYMESMLAKLTKAKETCK